MIPIQQQNPIILGFPPVFISLTMSVFRPIAAIASTMKNLLSSLIGENTPALTPRDSAIVVMMEAATKYRIKNGKICFKLTFFPASPLFFSFWVRRKARTSVIGIIARVRVSFTVTAVSSVAEPSPHILSHVEAAAVTEEVSFTAVPAKIPKASPVFVAKPMSFPKVGNSSAASTLKKKITEMACATSSSSASITGAVAAIAEPPQIGPKARTRRTLSTACRGLRPPCRPFPHACCPQANLSASTFRYWARLQP